MSAAVRIIGLGTLNGSDAAGLSAIASLERLDFAGNYPEGFVELHPCTSAALLPALCQGAKQVVLLDAVILPNHVDAVVPLTPDQLASTAAPCSNHACDVAQAIALTESLAEQPVAFQILGIRVAAESDLPSEPIELERRVVDRLIELLEAHIAAPN